MNGATCVMAIDPGAVSGAFALFHSDGHVEAGDMAVVDGQLDAAAFARLVRSSHASIAVVERVGAMPKQGVASTFKFGVSVGIVHGVLLSCGVPVHLVAPATWKRQMKLSGSDKEAARAMAIRLFPRVEGLHLKKHHNRAEALLLGHWFTTKE
jgi:hypothetical protein